MKKFIAYENSQYGDGIQIEEYNGMFSLVSAREKDGNVYAQWGYPQGIGKGAGPIDKCLPWKIKLANNKPEAVEMLNKIISTLTGEATPDTGKIPF